MSRQIHINLFMQARGHHESAWRHPAASAYPLTDFNYYREIAQTAEAGLFDSMFFADHLAVGVDVASVGRVWMEPVTTLAALAGATSRIGLIATASTTYTEPYNLARQFAWVDHISGGRVGWNVVTSWLAEASYNFGLDRPIEHDERYARADEFLDVVTGLWDSWADDAVLDDRHAGRYADPSRIHRLDHQGKYYRVRGPLNLPRPPQGRPVLVQAGSSTVGRNFAARHAEAVFTAQVEKEAAVEFYRDLKAQALAIGRDVDQILILPGLSPIIGSTEDEARRMRRELIELTDPQVGLARLSTRFGGHDFSGIDLDQPLTAADFPDPETNEAARSRTQVILSQVVRDRPTMRELLQTLAGARGHFTSVGTPEQVADMMEDWFRSGAADGFNLMPPVLPLHLERFVAEVVPILQRRGLFRLEYTGRHLRDHYGLDRPPNRHFD